MSLIVTGVLAGATLAGVVVIAPAVKQALDLAPFLYANTRCSARTAALLSQNFYSDIAAASSKQEAYALLEDTSYADIAEHAKNYSQFSHELYESLYKDYKWIESISPSKIKPIIKAITLKFEIDDIKQILNYLKQKSQALGSLSAPSLEHISKEELKYKLQSVEDVQSFFQAIEGTRYAAVLNGFGDEILDRLQEANTELDRYYILRVLKSIKSVPSKMNGAFLDYWRSVIDVFNARIAFRRMKDASLEFIPGGLLNTESLASASDLTQLEAALRESKYGEHLTELSPSALELAFSKSMRELAGLLNARHPLQAGYLVRYMILKELEIKNLNTALKLKEENFSEEEIKSLIA